MVKLHTLNIQAISHPIHRLPLELLEHIFHMLLEIESEDISWHEPFPLNLTQVCNQWKSLVLSARNRRLWSTVLIDPADSDWLERLHLHLFLSRDEGLTIHIKDMTQSIVDALTRHHRRIRSLPGLTISEIRDSTTSEPDTHQVVIINESRKRPISIPLSSSVKALPYVYLGMDSLHRLQSFSQLRVLIVIHTPQLLELGGPLQLPALQELLLKTNGNPLDLLRIFAPSQLLFLHLSDLGPLSPEAYYELETFIIRHMPNLRRVILYVGEYVDSVFVQPVEESTTQSSSARQSESLRVIECSVSRSSKDKTPPFERLIESAPHLEECYLVPSMKSLPCFSHHIRKLEFDLYYSTILPVVNGGLFKLAHLEVLKLTFNTVEQVQLLSLFQAPLLQSLEVYGPGPQSDSIPDAILAFISTSQGICDMILPFPVGGMGLSLPELRSLKIPYLRHIFLLASFEVPKLQHLFLEVIDGRDESIAGGEEVAEDPIGIASLPPAFEAVGRSNLLDVVNTRQILEVGNEEQKRNTIDEDDIGAEMDRLKDVGLHEAPSDPVVTRAPTFPALMFKNLKDFEFQVPTASDSYPIGVLPYFTGILTSFPALERVTLPLVPFNNSPYIDQLVKTISENPTLCPNLQEIRTGDYPNDWSNLLKFLRDRKRASMLSNPALRPIHALHFPITPHGSIVEQLQDAMLGKVLIKPFPALCPWPLIDWTFERIAPSVGVTWFDLELALGLQLQDGDERTAATRVQAQQEDITGNGDKQKQNEESSCGENGDEALSCFPCHKAGLGAGCCRVYRKRGILSRMEGSMEDLRCSRWDSAIYGGIKFEVVCMP